MKIELAGKTVLVTGGSRGIGKAIAEQIADAGATVALHFGKRQIPATQIANRLGNGSRTFQADLRETANCAQLISEVIDTYGHIDVLVNNAGIALPVRPDADLSRWTQVWEETLQVNLIAAAALCKLLVPHFIAKGEGRFIHIASRAAFRGDTIEYMAYAASKAGLVALSRSIARGHGKQGIKSFVIAPGFTRTDMAEDFIREYGEAYVKDDIALTELTLPEDIAPTAVFLASGKMDHATGCTIDINAGSYVR